MKRAIFFILAISFTGMLNAQVSFGPKAGMTLSKFGYKYSDELEYSEPKSNFKLGPAVGFTMDIPVVEFLAFQPSLMITKKGTGIDVADFYSGEAVVEGYYRVKVTYLELPLNLAIKLKLGQFRFQVFAGPYVAFALAGSNKWDYEINIGGIRENVSGSEKINFQGEVTGGDQDEEKFFQRPFDAGLDFGLGYQYDRLLINLGFAYGFSNLQPNLEGEDDYAADHKYGNRTIFLSAAWLFGGK